MKKIIIFVICILLLMSIMCVNVYAAEVPDLTRNGSVSITMTYRGEPVSGGALTIYRVADLLNENDTEYDFHYTQIYEDSKIPLNDLENPNTALELAKYTEKNKISGIKKLIDKNGCISFKELELGLYLLVQNDAADGFEKVSPFLVTVPGVKDALYVYDVEASPKLELKRAPVVSQKPSSSLPPKLPQTGLNQWPIPVLAIGGIFLIVLGLILYTVGKRKTNED